MNQLDRARVFRTFISFGLPSLTKGPKLGIHEASPIGIRRTSSQEIVHARASRRPAAWDDQAAHSQR